MRKYLLLFLLVPFTFSHLNAQVLKYKAKYISFKMADNKNERTWRECDLLIVIDTVKNKVHIYSLEEEDYDIVKFLKSDQKEDSYYSYAFKAVDKSGVECIMAISLVAKQSYDALLIISYNKYSYAYKMVND